MKKRRTLSTIILIILLIIFLFSSFNIIKWLIDNNNTKKELSEIYDNVEINEMEDSNNTELINAPNNEDSDYWDYIKIPLINVNFSELLKINKDTVGWIKVNGTNINYPFVQSKDNEYYLNHSFKKQKNDAGWVFLDYRNNLKDLDSNTIIYAHGRLDKTMFGSLKGIVKESWYTNKDNYVVRVSSLNENTLWQVFSVYEIKNEDYYLQNNFEDYDEYNNFLNKLIARSIYDFKTNVDTSDKIITLSTCHNDNRVVLHAKLIKKEKR